MCEPGVPGGLGWNRGVKYTGPCPLGVIGSIETGVVAAGI